MVDEAQPGDNETQPYRGRADKSGLFIGGMVLLVIVVPILIHLVKMALGVAT